jgi:hypothetical protein
VIGEHDYFVSQKKFPKGAPNRPHHDTAPERGCGWRSAHSRAPFPKYHLRNSLHAQTASIS